MRLISILILSIFCFSANAQLSKSPNFESINGVTKTVMNNKLYPLLLKVQVSKNSTNKSDFKNFISNLKHFEVFSTDGKDVAETSLFTKNTNYTNNEKFKKIDINVFELVSTNQKEYIIVKEENAKASTIYAFTTKLEYNGIKDLKLL